MTQPEALRLADLLDERPHDVLDFLPTKAASELRRLHEKCEALTADVIQEMRRINEIHALTAQRDALLEALKRVTIAPDLPSYGVALHNARAVIAKVESQQ